MQIKISVVKGSAEGTYTAKFSSSIGGGQERIKDVSSEGIADFVKKMLEKADEDGYVGKK